MHVAVIGAGWAGLAAAVTATRRGDAVTLFEASRHLGGRARRVDLDTEGATMAVDNGQHILIGAYSQTLALMRSVGVDPRRVLHRMPLVLRFPDGGGLALPEWPAPWNVVAGIATAKGWGPGDKLSLLRVATGWRLGGFRCDPAWTVERVCRGLTARVRDDLVEPLCVSALNVPGSRASGAVFLRVLRDSLFTPGSGGWAASDLLLPRADLGALLPDAAAAWLRANGAHVRDGVRVQSLVRTAAGWSVEGGTFDAVVLATPSSDAARLASTAGCNTPWVDAALGLAHESIATVYTRDGPALPLPMLALRSGPQAPAQFVFDRAQLGGPAGLLAWVVSASDGGAAEIEPLVLAQAAALGWSVRPLRTIVDRRATFACTPGLVRPPASIAPGLVACGDYVEGPYPSTLEGAVRSGASAVARLTAAAGTTA